MSAETHAVEAGQVWADHRDDFMVEVEECWPALVRVRGYEDGPQRRQRWTFPIGDFTRDYWLVGHV